MKLRDLNGELIRLVGDGSSSFMRVDTVAAAQGVWFLCPRCFAANGGARATHRVMCWFADRGVPADMRPLPGRWIPGGTTIDDLTFVGPAAASVFLQQAECHWHGFIRNGDAT